MKARQPTPRTERSTLPDLAGAEDALVDEIVAVIGQLARTGRFVGGPQVEQFEQSWARYCGTRQAIGVANGGDAVELTLRALGIGRGDEIMVPANAFIGTAHAVSAAGAAPRFVDVDPNTLLVTPETLEPGRSWRTAAILAVHLYGHPADTAALRRYADRHKLAFIEDASHAPGATLSDGGRAGAAADAGCFGFRPGGNMAAWGHCGAVVTDDETLSTEVRALADHGRDPDRGTYRRVGRGSGLDAIQAVVLNGGLRTLDADNARRRVLAARYRDALGPLAGSLVGPTDPYLSVWSHLVIRLPRRTAVRRALRRAGIATGVHYPTPCHLAPAYAQLRTESLPVAEVTAREVLSLPIWPRMPEKHADHVADELWRALAKPAPHRSSGEWRPPTQRHQPS